jgi:hypothetical protein
MSNYPITQFIVAQDESGRAFSRVRFLDLPDRQQANVSRGAMTVQSTSVDLTALWEAIDPLETDDGEATYIETLVTPDFIIASVENYMDEIFEGRFHGEEIDQEVIEAAFLGILPDHVESAHDAVEVAPLVQQMTDFANSLLPVPHHDDPDKTILMNSPDLATLTDR